MFAVVCTMQDSCNQSFPNAPRTTPVLSRTSTITISLHASEVVNTFVLCGQVASTSHQRRQGPVILPNEEDLVDFGFTVEPSSSTRMHLCSYPFHILQCTLSACVYIVI
jgi:hypothetical protein